MVSGEKDIAASAVVCLGYPLKVCHFKLQLVIFCGFLSCYEALAPYACKSIR